MHHFPVPLEVDEMRIQQITATIARTLTNVVVREIEAGCLFVCMAYFHLCYQRMPLGMSANAGSPSWRSSDLDAIGGIKPTAIGCKRSGVLAQPVLVTATSRERFAKV